LGRTAGSSPLALGRGALAGRLAAVVGGAEELQVLEAVVVPGDPVVDVGAAPGAALVAGELPGAAAPVAVLDGRHAGGPVGGKPLAAVRALPRHRGPRGQWPDG